MADLPEPAVVAVVFVLPGGAEGRVCLLLDAVGIAFAGAVVLRLGLAAAHAAGAGAGGRVEQGAGQDLAGFAKVAQGEIAQRIGSGLGAAGNTRANDHFYFEPGPFDFREPGAFSLVNSQKA